MSKLSEILAAVEASEAHIEIYNQAEFRSEAEDDAIDAIISDLSAANRTILQLCKAFCHICGVKRSTCKDAKHPTQCKLIAIALDQAARELEGTE